MKAKDVRQTFLKYFEVREHRVVKSSSLIPDNDPTLLFTNAGMNQFKDVFLGAEKRAYTRAASSQKCVRAGGKHNDLENVGYTARHHTFFEMLGNFSFGDYFKDQAIAYAWELVTKIYGLPLTRLYVTVYTDDDEAYTFWHRAMGVDPARIFRLGEKDNFWAMGDTGPCGPCSEIHYDLGHSPIADHRDCAFPCECGRYVEIWNLVFMQYERDQQGRLTPLPSPSIDTGMGLERITAVLQGKQSNYDTDLFHPIIAQAADLAEKIYGELPSQDISLRIIADHARAAAFLITDGVSPSNEGRGYVLRKIIRRALRHGRKIGLQGPFLFKMAGIVAELMQEAYPDLVSAREYTARVLVNEEEKFSATLTYGLERLDDLCAAATRQSQRQISGSDTFKLYDTYGFPLELAKEIVAERDLTIDEAGFQAELEKQRERAKASWKGSKERVSEVYVQLTARLPSRFVGYEITEKAGACVTALIADGRPVDLLEEGGTGEVVLDETPFYAESGGQVGDQGALISGTTLLEVANTFSPVHGLTVHQVKVERGTLRVGDSVAAQVNAERRRAAMRNHTGTHLLHAALRETLGEHVKQAGSLVAPDRLRFDFSHFAFLTDRELEKIEDLVNEQIQLDKPVAKETMDLDRALASGALAFFGEKYASRHVRVVSIDSFSKELCGGTHVGRTGEIGLLKIVGESSVAAGVRRIEAVTGGNALKRLQEDEHWLSELTEQLQVPRAELYGAVEKLVTAVKEGQKEIESLKLKLADTESQSLLQEAREIKGIKVIAHHVDNIDRNGLRSLADRLKNRMKSGVIILGAPIEGNAALVVMVSPDLTSRLPAGKLIKEIAPLVGGRGGGKPDLAEAGGKDISGLGSALKQSYDVVARFLS
ncbi:MAG: alanine--tRNA ligase [Acidobacteria bacterium]|nr:alanine--tRNA ligase [Acidobacteriota bacterium]MBI3658492.1 alanine--tRNA ligase [Acidobacteriota bacterium]